jgi:hypothetical protein
MPEKCFRGIAPFAESLFEITRLAVLMDWRIESGRVKKLGHHRKGVIVVHHGVCPGKVKQIRRGIWKDLLPSMNRFNRELSVPAQEFFKLRARPDIAIEGTTGEHVILDFATHFCRDCGAGHKSKLFW